MFNLIFSSYVYFCLFWLHSYHCYYLDSKICSTYQRIAFCTWNLNIIFKVIYMKWAFTVSLLSKNGAILQWTLKTQFTFLGGTDYVCWIYYCSKYDGTFIWRENVGNVRTGCNVWLNSIHESFGLGRFYAIVDAQGIPFYSPVPYESMNV